MPATGWGLAGVCSTEVFSGVGERSDLLGRYGSRVAGVVGVDLPTDGCPVAGVVLPTDGCPVAGVVLLAGGFPVARGTPGVRLLLADRWPVVEVAERGGLVRDAAAVPRRPAVPVGMDEDTGFNDRVGANRPITEELRAPDRGSSLPRGSPTPLVLPAVVLPLVASPASADAPADAPFIAPTVDPPGDVPTVRPLGAASWAALEASRVA